MPAPQPLSSSRAAEQSLVSLAAGADAVAFADCHNADVQAAAALGIVDGVGNGLFAPYRFITREQAAVMLARTAAVLGISAMGESVSFTDAPQFASWVEAAIQTASQILCGEEQVPLMQGVGNARFAPQSVYTVEQSVITLLRLTKAVQPNQ